MCVRKKRSHSAAKQRLRKSSPVTSVTSPATAKYLTALLKLQIQAVTDEICYFNHMCHLLPQHSIIIHLSDTGTAPAHQNWAVAVVMPRVFNKVTQNRTQLWECVYGYINPSFSGSASWLQIGVTLTALYKTVYKPVHKLILQYHLPIPKPKFTGIFRNHIHTAGFQKRLCKSHVGEKRQTSLYISPGKAVRIYSSGQGTKRPFPQPLSCSHWNSPLFRFLL